MEELLELRLPDRLRPMNRENNPCACMQREHLIKYKKGVLHWLCRAGDAVRAGDALCEAEVDKKIFPLIAPRDGVLEELLVEEGTEFACSAPVGLLRVREPV